MKELLLAFIAFFALSGIATAAVNLNTASKAELETVKGIGPQKAEAIVEYRKKNGPFKKVDDLKKVSGFGDKSVAKMRSELTVSAADSDKPASAKKEEHKPARK
jgi:competence protein ComEA